MPFPTQMTGRKRYWDPSVLKGAQKPIIYLACGGLYEQSTGGGGRIGNSEVVHRKSE